MTTLRRIYNRPSGSDSGGSAEIETLPYTSSPLLDARVAVMVVALPRLKPFHLALLDRRRARGSDGGGSAEIETPVGVVRGCRARRGSDGGGSTEIETLWCRALFALLVPWQ